MKEEDLGEWEEGMGERLGLNWLILGGSGLSFEVVWVGLMVVRVVVFERS